MESYKSITPQEVTVPQLHHLLLGAIGPRPICFASTIDKDGNRNLAPFSFFNVFSANPPIVVFSPAKSGRTGEDKHTYENVKEVAEVVINIVSYDMVHQMSLASSPYPKAVDEFVKTGFTPIVSDLVKPARVAESPVQMECKVNQLIELGTQGGAGNLIIAEVLKIHVREDLLMENGHIDQTKIDLVARMGDNWYCRANGDALFEIAKPITTLGIGVDALPLHIRNCKDLNGNHLGILGNLESLPTKELINEVSSGLQTWDEKLTIALQYLENGQADKALATIWNQ